MNRLNFDGTAVANYPLTIDRMAELQKDAQVPMEVLAGLLPLGGEHGSCILSGCESAGQAGHVLMKLASGGGYVYEVVEVRSGSSVATHLKLNQDNITAENSDGNNVVVRVERYLSWVIGEPASGTFVAYSGLPRVWIRTAAQDNPGWVTASLGNGWSATVGGSKLKVQHTGGRIHLYGDMAFPYDAVFGLNGTTAQSGAFLLPAGYRPAGDVLVPIKYNGNVACAILGSDGFLVLPAGPARGDTLKIDTYIEI